MDREQEEMQFLGIFGIYKEAYKIIFSWRKIFSQITLALILPLSFIFLAHMEVSNLLHRKLRRDKIERHFTRAGSAKYDELSGVISDDRTLFWLFEAAYFTFYLILSLLSTSAVVYTVACIYTGKEVAFKKVMSVVPKVWKRLIVTLLCSFFAYFVYNLFAVTVAVKIMRIAVKIMHVDGVESGNRDVMIAFFFLILGLYLVGFFYLTIVWHLSNVISVLEESCGFPAIVKSEALMKGKILVTAVIFFKLSIPFFIVERVFQKLVVHGWSLGAGTRICYGIICLLLLCTLILVGLVIQTVIYFVCKSYHNENIDKSTLSDHLEVYLGGYVPLKCKDIQQENYDV